MQNSIRINAERFSLFTPFGYQNGSCGYCKDPNTSGSYFASSKKMTVDHYQDLIERGWRRSGETLYKPDQIRSCCPHYTIRLPAAQLKPSRDQRQALNRWNRFVLGEEYIKESAKLYPKSKEEKKRRNNEFDLISTVHESEYTTLKMPPEPEHQFEVTLENTNLTDEKYALFEQYQRLVHHEPPSRISKPGFKRFLCDTPLVSKTREVDGKIQVLGSHHQCYRLDGKLIALGVVDLLPHGVSAVYFIYDREFEHWSFGKMGALREAALAIEGGYEFYNMGFYIHSCPKMRYKCDYKPQYLLDPDSYEWHLLDDTLKARLDAQKFVSPSRERRRVAPAAEADNATSTDEQERSVAIDTVDNTPKRPGGEIYDTPSEAVELGESMFSFGMPGFMSVEEVDMELSRRVPYVMFGKDGSRRILPATALRGWQDGSLTEQASLKSAVGELLGCVGVKVGREMIVDFTQ